MRKGFFILIAVLSFLSCKKKDQSLGKDILDPNAYLNGITTDTFLLSTSIILEDSTETDNAGNVVLGSYNDPKFGLFNASFYSQLRLAGINPNFGTVSNIVVDSFVLALEYTGYYGDLSAQTFEVYEMTESIHPDSTYYNFTVKNHSSTNLVPAGKGTLVPDPLNKTIVGGDSLQAQLRIHLDTLLAKQFIAEATSGSTTFSSDDNFKSYFKGLLVKTNNISQAAGQGGVFYFNLNDPSSKLTIYYSQAGSQKTYDLLLNSTCADFSHVDINHSGTAVDQVINNPSQGLQSFYAQAFGLRAKIVIPGLSNLTKNQLIHRAEIHLPIQYNVGYKYKPGANVTFATKKTAFANNYINTGVLGTYSEYTKEFSADLKQYVQAVINKDIENTGLIVSPRFFINSAERIIFNGPNTINKAKPRIVITYTTF
ncbi:MAG: DUF4270 family protein [Flavobacteriia bacterium]|nr:DUF4270 family protein [Flavobacteriia bacterium]NBV91287.1 DUF4270 family protein [Flavobacteriia bacterium]